MGVLSGLPMHSVTGSLKKFLKCPCPQIRKSGFGFVQQRGIVVFYDVIVGKFPADLLIEGKVIVELQVVGALSDVHLPLCRPACRSLGIGRPDREPFPASLLIPLIQIGRASCRERV